MSEAAVRFRQPIDLDEFERRLLTGTTSSNPTTTKEDPLAELARLVGQADPFRSAPAAPQLRPAAARGAGPVPHLQQVHPPLDRQDPPFGNPQAEPHAEHDSAAQPYVPAAASARDHAGFAQPAEEYVAVEDHAGHGGDRESEFVHGDVDILPPVAIAAADTPRRSWRGVIILSTVLATGFAGLAAALTMKGSMLTSTSPVRLASNGPPLILAPGPTKIQPPKSADVPDDTPSVLEKTGSTKPAKARIIDNVEQPVDLSQQPTKPRAAAAPPPPEAAPTAPPPNSAAVQGPQGTPLGGSQVPSAPVGLNLSAAPAPAQFERRAPAGGAGSNGFAEPKRVKVVSVRADGSIIGNDAEAPPAPPPATAPAAGPTAPAATNDADNPPPTIELGVTLPTAADPTARQQPPAAPERKAAAGSGDPAPAGEAAPRKDPVAALIDPKGAGRSAAAKTAADNAAEPPSAPKPKRGNKKNVEVADLGNQDHSRDQAAADGGDGTFAAQLAASPTESAAKSTLRKLKKKYASSFAGHKLSYRRVKVDGKTVFRVRVTGLSKTDAGSICDKLQSDGSTCFVANN